MNNSTGAINLNSTVGINKEALPEKMGLVDVFKDAYAFHGKRLFVLFCIMAIVGISEGLSMTLLLPLLTLIGVDDVSTGSAVHQLVDWLLGIFGANQSVTAALVVIFIAFFIQAVLQASQTWWLASMQRRYGAYWQQKLFKSFILARWGFIAKNKQGLLTNAITQECLRVSGAFMIGAQSASHVLVATIYIGISMVLSWQITLLLLLIALILSFLVKGIAHRNYILGVNISASNSKLMVFVNEFISGSKLVKATSTEPDTISQVDKVSAELAKYHTWSTFFPGLTKGIFEFASIVSLCGLLVIGHTYLNTGAAEMLLIFALFVRLLPRFNALQQNIQLLNSLIPALSEVKKLYSESSIEFEGSEPKKQIDKRKLGGPLKLHKVDAGYPGAKILNNICIEFPTIGYFGIVGESGAGKSTLVNTLLGLCDVQQGELSIGSTLQKDIGLSTWRKMIGYVPQETILFHRSIKENLLWGNDGATEQDLIEAAIKAKAHDFISELNDGYDTIIGDQGLRLSGGQRQRIGIARALLGSPKFLLLDEATSALDSESEKSILDTLETLRNSVCIISIAHRLSTVKTADKIYVFSKGSVSESGNWESLIVKKGILFNLADKQHMV